VLLETHCLDWPAHLGAEGAYGKIVCLELLHKLHDKRKYDSLEALTAGIRQDCLDARAYFDAHRINAQSGDCVVSLILIKRTRSKPSQRLIQSDPVTLSSALLRQTTSRPSP